MLWLGALLALLPSGISCVTLDEASLKRLVPPTPGQAIQLPEVEQMIDELDRIMTMNGTIGVKSPDVWGQDRLAKFRSEYETQMAEWLKINFKGDINVSTRRGESDAHRVQLGMELAESSRGATTSTASAASVESITKTAAAADATALAPQATEKVVLEPTVVLDEHSNYLNHLNQLRRINAGDDLTDRPGYGLYLVRIPVTLSPGPRSRRGKGAIITVSAKSLVTRDTLRNTLRNVVINETVNNLTQAICNRSEDEGEPSLGLGAGPFSLVAYADSEIMYGMRNINLLKEQAEHQLARDLGDEPHHRRARVADWLREELEASYHALEAAATPVRKGDQVAVVDPLEKLGDLLVRHDFAQLAKLNPDANASDGLLLADGARVPHLDPIAPEDPVSRRKTLEFLSFALQLQAAAVNRRLKQDMADQDPSLRPERLKEISFFAPDPSDTACHYFEKFVNSKWPLRVYAIEPVIAQQNVADAFTRRSQASLELAGGSPLGRLRILNGLAVGGLATDRKTAEDETAIRLNPTMVGFGAGESTFGWIFYPRLQTRLKDGLFTKVSLLLNGRFPDPTGREQSIEPGQRECTALIVMPNFIPKIEFVTVANWFRTSEVGEGQKSDLEKASTLGRKLVEAERALIRATGEGQYRPEEYQIAFERLNQLRSMMPTQRMVVRVPYTDNNNDSRIFCSQGGQLRPLLLGWHGRPPQEGTESTILLEGKNFSVHDTHVVAGGKPAKAVLVSRNVMEVTIARDACPTPSADGKPLLDVNVATPNGVSNHLLITMQPPCSKQNSEPCDLKPANPKPGSPPAPPAPEPPPDSKEPTAGKPTEASKNSDKSTVKPVAHQAERKSK
jgi:hypothetical protein